MDGKWVRSTTLSHILVCTPDLIPSSYINRFRKWNVWEDRRMCCNFYALNLWRLQVIEIIEYRNTKNFYSHSTCDPMVVHPWYIFCQCINSLIFRRHTVTTCVDKCDSYVTYVNVSTHTRPTWLYREWIPFWRVILPRVWVKVSFWT